MKNSEENNTGMKILENLKLDTWWGIVLYMGVACMAASLYIKVDFIEQKHLFGFGLGMFLIGLSFIMANKTATTFIHGGMLSTKITQHNFISVIILIIGLVLTGIFCFLVIKKLI